ncbi:SgcJ/EcaC family oxidoreductase [Brevundimonas sp.]|uniref:SgcJ/EcaC family oxidoreductase n=1 Tax=Brevundimonas sp. TaxID=1871086 RepID=UPI003F6ED29D
MKTLQILAFAGLLSAAAPAAMASAWAQHSGACPHATTADIDRQFGRFSEAWATLDPDVVTALFSADPVLLPTVSNQPRTTPAGVRDYFVAFLKNRPVARIHTSTTEIDCRTASRVGTWTVTLTDPVTGAARDVNARYSFLYRFEDGDWKIDHLHSSMMPEPASAPAH